MKYYVYKATGLSNGEEIYLALASKRMRILFYNWLNDEV